MTPTRPSSSWRNIAYLCRKEWLALFYDSVLMFFIIFSFTYSIYQQAQGGSLELHKAAIGIVDEDQSALSRRFVEALLPPYFGRVEHIRHGDVDAAMENATYTFVLQFPVDMEKDLRAGKDVTLQLLIDASAVGQAQTGSGYIRSIFQTEMLRYFGVKDNTTPPVGLVVRYAYNQGQRHEWFMGVAALIQNISMLAIALTGAALIRERERGTIEHLLVMPVTPLQIVLSKVIANGSVILLVSLISIETVLRYWVGVDIQGSVGLFLLVSVLYLFFSTGLGIFLGTIARSMPQMGLLFILTVLPMNLLSGAFTPLESMPAWLHQIIVYMPATAYVSMAQAILFRGGGFSVVWQDMLIVSIIGLAFFTYSTLRFRSFLERQG
ncbi:MAG: ABC transporter permease [Rickettsiales bacterium]|nr:ABC transporter permease [Rickettsiales bacterium]